MKRRQLLVLASLGLGGCGGVPLRAIPRLMQLPEALLKANLGDFRVALNVDARVVPPSGAVPLLGVRLTPKVDGAFESVDKKLPLQLDSQTTKPASLPVARAGRHWLVYSLPPTTLAELSRIQTMVQQAQALPGYQKGGQLSVAIEQTRLALTDPQLADTRWETWLQAKADEGFFMVWSGTPAKILALTAGKR
ncbi:MAG: hypothetical protein R3E56_05730 [Burkholderiaceae bacterium]